MRVLVVARCKNGKIAPFISEQIIALSKEGVEIGQFRVTRSGILGYIKELPKLKKVIREFKPDIVHAHYGLCGVLANMQRVVPVVTTYHGSDINLSHILHFSRISIKESAYNIFVSQKCIDIARPRHRYALIPCGVDLEDFPTIKKEEAKRIMGLKAGGKYILFAGAFSNKVKNAPLAKAAMQHVTNSVLLELKGYSRSQVCTLMQAVDALLMTSLTEGSPQVIKEALVCGCPIVSVDVGDVKDRITGIDGCYITDYNAYNVADCICKAIKLNRKTTGRERIVKQGLDNRQIAKKIIGVYNKVIEMAY